MVNKIDLAGSSRVHSSVVATAGATEADGSRPYVFVCRNAVNFVANDSGSNALDVNFDAPIGRAGTFRLYPGETMSDLQISCREIFVRGVGAAVPFRAVGS